MHRGGGERWLTERSSRLMLPAPAGMWVMLSLQGEGARQGVREISAVITSRDQGQ
jgi:hypothetical protein